MADVAMGFLFVQATGCGVDPTPWDSRDAGHVDRRLEPALHCRHGAQRRVRPGDSTAGSGPSGRCPRAAISLDGGAAARLAAAGARAWRWARAPVFFTGHLRPGVVAALLATAILLYDAWLKRTPLGPLAMGACRMLNVLLGHERRRRPLARRALAGGRRHRRLRGRRHVVRPQANPSKAAACNWPLATLGDGAGHCHAGLASRIGPTGSFRGLHRAAAAWYLLDRRAGHVLIV